MGGLKGGIKEFLLKQKPAEPMQPVVPDAGELTYPLDEEKRAQREASLVSKMIAFSEGMSQSFMDYLLMRNYSQLPSLEEFDKNYKTALETLQKEGDYLSQLSMIGKSLAKYETGVLLGGLRKIGELLTVGANLVGSGLWGIRKMDWNEAVRYFRYRQFLMEQPETSLGFFNTLLDVVTEVAGISPMYRWVEWVDAHGKTHRDNIRGELVGLFLRNIAERGGKVVNLESTRPSGTEKAFTWIFNLLDLAVPYGANVVGTGMKASMRLALFPFKAVKFATKLGISAVGAPLVPIVAGTTIAKNIQKVTTWAERNTGVATNTLHRWFNTVFAPVRRGADAKVEQAKRVIQGVDDYILNGTGWLANAIETSSEQFTPDFVLSVNAMRQSFKEMSERVGLEEAKRIYREAQAVALFRETGLPLSKPVVEALERLGVNPDDAEQIMRELMQYNGVDLDALRTLVATGRVADLKPLVEDVDRLRQASDAFPTLYRTFLFTRDEQHENLTALIKWLNEESPNLDDLTSFTTTPINPTLLEKIEQTLPAYKKAVRTKLAGALYIITQEQNPVIRQALTDYLVLHMGATKEVSLQRLMRTLSGRQVEGVPNEILQDIFLTAKRLHSPEEAQQVIGAMERLMGRRGEFYRELDRFEDILRRLEKEGIDPEIALRKCLPSGEGVVVGGVAGAGLLGGAWRFLEYVFGNETPDGNIFVKAENLLRSDVIEHLNTAGKAIDDLSDDFLKQWLKGEVAFATVDAPPSVQKGLEMLEGIATSLGIDYELINKAVLAHRATERQIVQFLRGYGKELSPAELSEMFYGWGSAKVALLRFIKQFEREGRHDVVTEFKRIIDQHDTTQKVVSALFGNSGSAEPLYYQLPKEVRDAYDSFFTTYGSLYWLGKSYALNQSVNIVGRELLNYQKAFLENGYRDVVFFTEEPTLTHNVLIESGELKGLYTTEYIANALKSYDTGADTIWKGALDLLNNLWKMSAVVWNPIAIIRDFLSNSVAMLYGLHLPNHQWYKIAGYYRKAWNSVMNRDEHFIKMASETPTVWGATIQVQELQQELLYQMQSAYPSRRLSAWVGNLPVLRHLQAMRGMTEVLGKMAMYHAIQDEMRNVSVEGVANLAKKYAIPRELLFHHVNSLATLVAEKYMLDYQDVNPVIKFLRRYLGVMPFITYEAKMMSLLLNTASEYGDSIGYMLRAINAGQRLIAPSEEEREHSIAVRKMLPMRMRDNPLTIAWYDKQSHTAKAIDLSFWVPFGALLPLYRIINESMNPDAFLREVRERVGGIVVPLVEVLINRELFTGKNIYEPTADGAEQRKAIFQYLMTELPVPIIPPSVKRWGTVQMFDPKQFEETYRKYTLPELLFSVYQIDVNKAEQQANERMLQRANLLLAKGLKAYSELVETDPKRAEQVLAHYIKEANEIRQRAEDFANSIYTLRYADRETSELLFDPVFGFNPNDPYGSQVGYLRQVFDFMRANNRFPQNTSKWDILEALVKTAEEYMRRDELTNAVLEDELKNVEAWNNDWEERMRQRERSQRSATEPLPFAFPSAPFTPNITDEAVEMINQYVAMRRISPVFGVRQTDPFVGNTIPMMPMLTMPEGKQLDTNTILRQYANAMGKAFVPSLGGGKHPAGRPVGGGGDVA